MLSRKVYWAGIGARETPQDIRQLMTVISLDLFTKGLVLRSGGAKGADAAFAKGCPASHKIIYRAKDATEEAMNHASKYHPNWKRCTDLTRRLMARNSMIILGSKLDTPISFCICWTINGKETGGTGQALRICKDMSIPVYNLGNPSILNAANYWLNNRSRFFIDINQILSKQI